MNRIGALYLLLLKWIVVLCMAGMVGLVFSNVVLRYVFNSGLPASEEFARWLFVWMVFVGAMLVLLDNGHLGFSGFVNSLPKMVRRASLAVAHAIMIVITWLIISGSWVQMKDNLHSYAPATGFSRSFFFLAGMVFGLSSMALLAWRLFKILTGRMDKMIVIDEEAEALAHHKEPAP